ncbi:MAG: hypothetical protein KDA81_19515 [Planctomycetaceae bacterium]|nr:hypothetical protein [Planctomycetaceae bacterium]
MRWLERKFGHLAIHNITLYIIVLQVMTYVMTVKDPRQLERILLIPDLVMQGEYYRLVSFLVLPPVTNPVFAFFFWYLFQLMGSTLEHGWGAFRYNMFLLIGYLATVAAAFVTPQAAVSNWFLEGTVFLAFAYLFPDFELRLFFILPIKIKWFALLTWIGFTLAILTGPWSIKLTVLAMVLNFLLFFGPDIATRMGYGHRRMLSQVQRLRDRKQPAYFHKCEVCGITDKTHPDMDFRYCSECSGTQGYCSEHIRNHEHK